MINGLTSAEVEESKKAYGLNVIPEAEPTTFWDEFKETFSDPMIRILCFIAALMIGLFIVGDNCLGILKGYSGSIFEPIGTVVAVILVATISAKTAVSSDESYRSLKDRSEKDKCKVIRDGRVQEITFEELVVGDIVKLQSGDKIPADGILIEGQLKVDNSALNGESEEAKKFADPDATLPDAITGDTFVDKSSLFRGAIVTDGEGYLKIQKIALETMMGKMAQEMTEDDVDSPLKVKLSKLANQISVFGYCAAGAIVLLNVVVFFIKLHQGTVTLTAPDIINSVVNAIDLAILIIVCAVPEGLPLMISLVLMQNTSKMLDHNVLVRKAIGIETAGSLNILFSDKTGTITKGHLEVVNFIDGTGAVVEPEGELKSVLNNIIINSTQCAFDKDGNVFGGNMTDKALLRYVGKKVFESTEAMNVTTKQDFNSANKFSQFESGKVVFYKGAPEKIITKCTHYLSKDGHIEEFDATAINETSLKMANEAKRLLAFAFKPNSSLVENELQDGLTLVGLTAIRDDVRPEAAEAIATVKKAGIQVVMITGDRLETAKAIAADAGLISKEAVILTEENKVELLKKYEATTTDASNDGIVVSSDMLNKLSDDEVKVLVSGIKVIARALPTDKSRMVRICQEMNLVCGMTGDGVNDSPALKKADVGFAMGSGTEAAKEAGDLVILDDNFRSIKDAIWYGRTIYHNILKFVKFQLAINVGAVLITLLWPVVALRSGVSDIDAPLTVVMLLFVNLVMDGLGAMMLGSEPAEEKYMSELPRRRDESIISKSMAGAILLPALWMTVVGFVLLSCRFFGDLTGNELNAAFFAFFIWLALCNGFNVRSNKFGIFKQLNENPGFLKVLGIIIAAQAVIINAGFIPVIGNAVSKAFTVAPLNITTWIVVAVSAASVIVVESIRKLFVKK
jgi:magnesium-transporting ATPase (P-type)